MTFFDFFKVVGKSILFTIFFVFGADFCDFWLLAVPERCPGDNGGAGVGYRVSQTSIWRQFRDLTGPREQGNRLHTAGGEPENGDPDPGGRRQRDECELGTHEQRESPGVPAL